MGTVSQPLAQTNPTAIADVLRRLDALRRTAWALSLMAGLLRWGAATAVAGAVLVAVGSFLPPWARLVGLAAWAAGSVWLASREWLGRLLRVPTREDLAGRIEDADPDAQSRVIAAVQLHADARARDRLGYDSRLLNTAIDDGARAANAADGRLVLSAERRHALQGVSLALVATVIVAGLGATGVVSADRIRALWQSPTESFTYAIESVQPGNAAIQHGGDVPVRALIRGTYSGDVSLRFRETGESDWRSLRMEKSGAVYEASILHIVSTTEYQVVAGKEASEQFALSVASPPVVESLRVHLRFPEYSGVASRALEDGNGDVTALVGTRVDWQGTSAVPLRSARLDFDETEDVELAVDGSSFTGGTDVTASDRYALVLTSSDGVTHADPPRYVVVAVPDSPPELTVTAPGTDTSLDRTMRLGLQAEAVDDFGVSKFVLRYSKEEGSQPAAVVMASHRRATPVAQVAYSWDLGPLDLFPGESVSYYVEAWDNDTVSGPKFSVSPTYRVRFPAMEELFDELAASQQSQSDALASISEEQQAVKDVVDTIVDKLRKEQELTLRDRKDLEQAAQRQADIEQRREELAREVAKELDAAQRNDLMNPETLSKVAEMQRLLDEVASEQLKEALKKLQETLQSTELGEQRRKLMEASFDQEAFRQRIEQMIDMLEKAVASREVQKALRMAEELVEQQRIVVEGTEALRSDVGDRKPRPGTQEAQRSQELADDESRVEQGAKDLLAQVELAQGKLASEEALKQVADELDRLRNEAQTQDLVGDLSKAQGRLAQRDPAQAQPPATSALQQLQAMRQGLDNANEFMQGADGERIADALRASVRDTLHVAAEQEEVLRRATQMNQSRSGVSSSSANPVRQQLAVREQTLREGIDQVSRRLEALSEEEIRVPLEVAWGLREASDAARRAVQALEANETERAVPILGQALGSLNTTTLRMLDALNSMNAQMQQSGLQGMMDQLDRLAQGQADLNRLAEQIMEQMRRQGQTPGGDQTMERMAFEQSLIREATERLASRLKGMEQVLGELGDLGPEMQEVERRLQASQMNRDVLERMRRIETRMLESSKSLQQRETGKDRRAQTARRLFDDQKGVEDAEWRRIRERFRSGLSELDETAAPEAYRPLIRAYFRALASPEGERNGAR